MLASTQIIFIRALARAPQGCIIYNIYQGAGKGPTEMFYLFIYNIYQGAGKGPTGMYYI